MRAGMVLEALTAHYSVSLLVVRLYASREDEIPERFVRMCRRSAAASLQVKTPEFRTRFKNRNKRGSPTGIPEEYRAFHFDVIHVFRLAMVPFAQEFMQSSPEAERHLDLDEVESAMHSRLASLSHLNGDLDRAGSEEAAAQRVTLLEKKACAMFRRIYISSPGEREKLLELDAAATVTVLPNGVRLPDPLPPPPAGLPYSFLFAGTLGYYPNEDAVLHLCRDIVPRIRQRTRAPFGIEIVGPGAGPGIRDAVRQAGLKLVGWAADIRLHYLRAGAIVVPMRAGAGTRIKILEAWSYRRPVVTTAVGIEGLPGRDGMHALIADTADSFAEGCVRLMEDPELSRGLTANGYTLVSGSYSLKAIETAISAAAGQFH